MSGDQAERRLTRDEVVGQRVVALWGTSLRWDDCGGLSVAEGEIFVELSNGVAFELRWPADPPRPLVAVDLKSKTVEAIEPAFPAAVVRDYRGALVVDVLDSMIECDDVGKCDWLSVGLRLDDDSVLGMMFGRSPYVVRYFPLPDELAQLASWNFNLVIEPPPLFADCW